MANVGKNIRLLRKQKHMTQDDLAERLYVSRQTVSNYETGRSNPDIDMLVKIAEVLQTDVNILIFGIPVSPSRKKEYRRLLAGGMLLMALVLLFVWLTPREAEWRRRWFDLGPLLAMQMLLRPAACLVGGWTLMQGISLLWGLKKQTGKVFAAAWWGAAVLLGAYLILAVPFCAMHLYASWQLTQVSDFSTIPYFLPDLWQSAALFIWQKLILHFSSLFFLLGVVLWNRVKGCRETSADWTVDSSGG